MKRIELTDDEGEAWAKSLWDELLDMDGSREPSDAIPNALAVLLRFTDKKPKRKTKKKQPARGATGTNALIMTKDDTTMTTYTETTKTWDELTHDQRRMVINWFQLDEITNSINGLEFIIDDTGAVVGCTTKLDSVWSEA